MYLEKVIKERNTSKMKVAMMSEIAPSDFYQAINGKLPFFKGWRERVAIALNMSEEELFPEYKNENK